MKSLWSKRKVLAASYSSEVTMYAFPSGHNPKTGTQESGMTLRDYFAAKLMSRMLDKTSSATENWYEDSAKKCYLMADAMMKARDL